MRASFRVWGEYSMPVIKEVWEGEMPSKEVRELAAEDYNLEHCCTIPPSNTHDVLDTYCYIFIHKDYPDATAHCHSATCTWSFTCVAPAGTRGSLVIQVPRGIPALYTIDRDNKLRALFEPQE